MSLYPQTYHFQGPLSARYEFVTPPEPEPDPEVFGAGEEDEDEIMEEKKEIVYARDKKLKMKGPAKNKGLPGQRLLKKLAKQQQLEQSICRVVRNLQQ